MNPSLSPNARVGSIALVAVGTGHVDFKTAFAHTSLGRLKHFGIEQDNAAAWAESLAAARVSYHHLAATLA